MHVHVEERWDALPVPWSPSWLPQREPKSIRPCSRLGLSPAPTRHRAAEHQLPSSPHPGLAGAFRASLAAAKGSDRPLREASDPLALAVGSQPRPSSLLSRVSGTSCPTQCRKSSRARPGLPPASRTAAGKSRRLFAAAPRCQGHSSRLALCKPSWSLWTPLPSYESLTTALMSSIRAGRLPRAPRDSRAPQAHACESGSAAPTLAGVSAQICFHLQPFCLSFTKKLLMKGWRQREKQGPPQLQPLSSGSRVSLQPPRLQASPSSRAGPFQLSHGEPSLARGEKCDATGELFQRGVPWAAGPSATTPRAGFCRTLSF